MAICCSYCCHYITNTDAIDNAIRTCFRHDNNDNDSADIQEYRITSISLPIIGIFRQAQFQHLSLPYIPVLPLYSADNLLASQSDYNIPDSAVLMSLLVVYDRIWQNKVGLL